MATKDDFRTRVRALVVSPPTWYELFSIFMTLSSIGVFVALSWGRHALTTATPLLLRIDAVVWLFFVLEYLLGLIPQRSLNAGLAWACKPSALVDLLAIISFCSVKVPRAFICMRALRLLKHVALWRKQARALRRADAASVYRLSAALLSVLLQLGTTLTVTAALLWDIEGATGVNPSMQSLGDAYYYALNVFTGEGPPFPVVTGRGKIATALAIVFGLCTVPLSVAELVSALGISTGGTGGGQSADREFWVLQLQRLDQLESSQRLAAKEALQLRRKVYKRDRTLAVVMEAYEYCEEDNSSIEQLVSRLREIL